MDRTHLRFLWNYVDLALLRDVVERHGVTNLAGWRWLVRHLLGHPAAMCGVEKCYVALKSRGIAISKDPLYQLLGFLEDCYLLHPPGRAAVEAQIVAKAQGNPCFLGELTQAVAAQDADASPLVVPDTMQAALLARLDRLPPAAKRLLQTAAVIGREVPWSLLRAVANLPDDALHQRLPSASPAVAMACSEPCAPVVVLCLAP